MTLILIALVVLSAHYLNQTQTGKQVENNKPDFYVWDAHYVTYNALGQRHGELRSPLTKHYKKNNTTQFTMPRVIINTKSGERWVIKAKQGQSQHGDKNIHLTDHVVVYQYPKQLHQPTTRLTTNSLYIYPKQSKALSHQRVIITRDDMQASGIGLISNLKTGNSQLLSQSKGIFTPKPKNKR